MKVVASILAAVLLALTAAGAVLADPRVQQPPQSAQAKSGDETSTATTPAPRPFVWGRTDPSPTTIDQSKGKYTMFLPDGTPTRATAKVTQKGRESSSSATSTTTATTRR